MAKEKKKALDFESEIRKRLREERLREKLMYKKKLREQRKRILRRTRRPINTPSYYNRMGKFQNNEELEESIVPAIGLSIGGYSRFTGKDDVSVTAFFSSGIQRLQWEIVEGPLRRRLAFSWDGISGLELKLNECGLACLTVEVNRQPSCLMYMPKCDAWGAVGDFTDDKILWNLLPHYVLFKPGTVDESYEKLVNDLKERAILREKVLQRVRETQLQETQLLQLLGKLSTTESEKEENK